MKVQVAFLFLGMFVAAAGQLPEPRILRQHGSQFLGCVGDVLDQGYDWDTAYDRCRPLSLSDYDHRGMTKPGLDCSLNLLYEYADVQYMCSKCGCAVWNNYVQFPVI